MYNSQAMALTAAVRAPELLHSNVQNHADVK